MHRRFPYTRQSPQPRERKAVSQASQVALWSGVGAGVVIMMIAAVMF